MRPETSWPPGRWAALACIPLGLWLLVASLVQSYWLSIALGREHPAFGAATVRR